MGLQHEDLDDETRKYMLEEIEMDIRADKVYRSKYLTQSGQGNFPDLMSEAAKSGNDDTLTASLRGQFNQTTERKRPNGYGYYTAAVPVNAAEVLAESEFNRYFVRGLCRRAIASGIQRLQVFRAKRVANPRPESERLIGLLVDPEVVLEDVRKSQEHGVETALGIPPGPGSGITIRIPKT
jgi:hypothetical protein